MADDPAPPDRGGSGQPGDSAGDRPADAASPQKVDRLAQQFREAGLPFASVTVVRREPPVSATVGDRALVTTEGDLHGWIGGAACAQSVVVEAAADALAADEPLLVGLAPDPADVDRPGLESYPLTCHSEGTLELFVEPIRSVPSLVVVGDTPIARTLARLASELTYDVTLATDDADAVPEGVAAVARTDEALDGPIEDALAHARYVVVASMGTDDERALAAALRGEPAYVALVASVERRDAVAGAVAAMLSVDPEVVVDAVTTPAGLDIGAQTAEEIAVSVLAELVAHRRGVDGPIPLDVATADLALPDVETAAASDTVTGTEPEAAGRETRREAADQPAAGETDTAEDKTAVDPVCGMTVVVDEAAVTVEHEGTTYHFCGEGCADAFKADPGRYVDTEMTASG